MKQCRAFLIFAAGVWLLIDPIPAILGTVVGLAIVAWIDALSAYYLGD